MIPYKWICILQIYHASILENHRLLMRMNWKLNHRTSYKKQTTKSISINLWINHHLIKSKMLKFHCKSLQYSSINRVITKMESKITKVGVLRVRILKIQCHQLWTEVAKVGFWITLLSWWRSVLQREWDHLRIKKWWGENSRIVCFMSKVLNKICVDSHSLWIWHRWRMRVEVIMGRVKGEDKDRLNKLQLIWSRGHLQDKLSENSNINFPIHRDNIHEIKVFR
jgi:hypothetical protein